jgi:hypothetical protein
LPSCAQATDADQLVRDICQELSTKQSLLIIDGVDEIAAVWRERELNWLFGSGGAASLGQTRCLVTSRATSDAIALSTRAKCIDLKPSDNEAIMETLLARCASNDAQLTLDPAFQV